MSLSYPPQAERPPPILFVARRDSKLRETASKSNKIYIFGLLACVESVFRIRGDLWGRKVILIVDNEAACAVLTRGTAASRVAPTLVYSLWAIAAQHDISIWTGRAPAEVNPADLSARRKELSFSTETSQVLATVVELFSFFYFSGAFQQTK